MNDYQDHEFQSNVKIVVRIRNNPADKNTLNETEASIKRIDTKSLNVSKTNGSNVSKVNGKSSSSANKSFSRSKSPSEIKHTTPSLKPSGLDESKKYSIFTSTAPSGSIVITNKAISGKIINETFLNKSALYEYSYSILKDATLLEYERVYNETHKLDVLYGEQIKDSISNLFLGRNSCCLLFGPSESGKSFTLRGGAEGTTAEIGVLGRALGDLFNLVEISKQANSNSKVKASVYFAMKMSVYQVYLDQINDLLTNHFSKSLRLEKFYDNENNLRTEIIDLTQKEVRNKKDYDSFLKEAMQYRKNLAQTLKVNEMKKKSHMVISIMLEKRERVSEGPNKMAERSLDKFAQIDFVELAASNFGLSNLTKKKNDPSQCDDLLYKNTSKTFNSICNNIVSASVGIQPKYDSKLTLALKNTLNANSQISFISCVIPCEEPPVNALKCLKFTNWLRNQVHNAQENRDYKINSNFEDSFEGDVAERDRSRDERQLRNVKSAVISKQPIKIRKEKQYYEEENTPKNIRYNTINNDRSPISKNRPEREFPSSEEDEQEIRQLRERMKKKYPYMQSEGNYTKDNATNIMNTPQSRQDEFSYSDPIKVEKEYKLKEVEKSLRDLEAKSLEMSRCIENMRVERSRVQPNEDSYEMNRSALIKTSSGLIDYDCERLKQENATIKSDNIIFREDINRLSDINRHLEDELSRQRNRNLELAAENERLAQEKIQIKNEVDKLNENVSRVKVQETSLIDQFNQRFLLENKIRDYENENRSLRDAKQKFEVDFRVLTERHSELKNLFANSDGELNFIKTKQSEEVSLIETKLEKMAKEIEILQRENNSLRVNEERLRQELSNSEKQKDNYRDKYQDYKAKNNLLNIKLTEIDDDFRKLMLEKQSENFEKKKEDESKKMKIETKQKILEDMQSRISNYKTELFRQRNKKEEY